MDIEEIKIGDKVKIKENCKVKHLVGCKGTVVEISSKTGNLGIESEFGQGPPGCTLFFPLKEVVCQIAQLRPQGDDRPELKLIMDILNDVAVRGRTQSIVDPKDAKRILALFPVTPQGDDEGLLKPEDIITIAQKTKGKWVTNEWLDGEGADFKAGILVGSEAQRDLTRQEIPEAVKQETRRIINLMDEAMVEFDDHIRVGNFIALLQQLRRQVKGSEMEKPTEEIIEEIKELIKGIEQKLDRLEDEVAKKADREHGHPQRFIEPRMT